MTAAGTAKAFQAGTHRTIAPADTVAHMRPLLRDMGITRVANVTGMDHIGISTVMVIRPNARSLTVSQGKGADLDAAKASGIMESVEQYHAERIDRPLRLARLEEIHEDAGRVADARRLPGAVRPWGPGVRILWIQGTEVGSADRIWVPYELVHLDFTLPLPAGSGCFLASSTGLASGNHFLEAVCHGLCEAIERDALTLFYLLPAALQWQRRVDLDGVDDPVCADLLARYRRAGVDVAVWDITSDVGVAAFLCSILDSRPDPFRPTGIARGAGCHGDRNVALARALCEAAQSRLTRIVGSRDDLSAAHFDHLRTEEADARARGQMATPGRPPRALGDVPTCRLATFEDDLAWIAARLEAAGVGPAIVVDLSRAAYPVHVARAIVPGLEAPSEIPGYRPGARAARLQRELAR